MLDVESKFMRTVTRTNEQGEKLDEVEIIRAHTGEGTLHLAFSAYVFDPSRTTFLMQKRAQGKMLFPGYWANSCCSHPFPNETGVQAGERRLKEELGIDVTMREGPHFVYRAEDPQGRGVEHEYVQILIGTADTSLVVTPDPKEVEEWQWIDLEVLKKDMLSNPDRYAPWFHLGLKKVLSTSH
jgi:isopentenyl-diphosphate Delta-isomerase